MPASVSLRRALSAGVRGAAAPGLRPRTTGSSSGPSQNGIRYPEVASLTHAMVPCNAKPEKSASSPASSPGNSPDRVDALVWGLTSLFTRLTGRRKRADDAGYQLKDITGVENRKNVYAGESDTSWMAG